MMDNEKILGLKEIIRISGKHCPEIVPIVRSILSREYEDKKICLGEKSKKARFI